MPVFAWLNRKIWQAGYDAGCKNSAARFEEGYSAGFHGAQRAREKAAEHAHRMSTDAEYRQRVEIRLAARRVMTDQGMSWGEIARHEREWSAAGTLEAERAKLLEAAE